MAAVTNTNAHAASSPSPPSSNAPPPKPWERAGSSTSGPTPFRPPSNSSTSTAVEAAGAAKPGEIVTSTNTLARDVPRRPWEQNYGSSYAGPVSSMNYNSGYGSSMVGGGMYGGSYGSGLYGSNMYNRGYGSYGNSLYGGGMMGGGHGGGMMSGYGGGMMGMGGPYGNQDPNNSFGGPPPSPPGFWMSFLRVMQGIVNFFGRISILIDQNTQAFHMFMSALLQLFDRSGVLYGELARFVLRLLGVKTKPRKQQMVGPGELPGPAGQHQYIEGPKAAAAAPPTGSWDNVWGD